MQKEILKEIREGLEKLQQKVDEGILKRENLEEEWRESGSALEFANDDWIYDSTNEERKREEKSSYPSETASISLTKRDETGNITATGIAALYQGFPIVVGDESGAYIYTDNRLLPVIAVDEKFIRSKACIRCHIFGQKSTPHWVWMNDIIGELCKAGIRTDNNMGPYFLLRDFFYYYQETEEGIVISPIKAVVSEPYLNSPKNEIVPFLIQVLNKRLPEKQQFFISDMSGQNLFTDDDEIRKMLASVCPIYCTDGWIAGSSKEFVFTVLQKMKETIEKVEKPAETNEKIKKLISDLQHLK